jgi:dihydroxyacetone kinase-like predicted kinase
MKPVEGTILTVAKDAAKAAVNKAEETVHTHIVSLYHHYLLHQLLLIRQVDLAYYLMIFQLVMEYTIAEAEKSLNNTPNLLAVLKEVGVVDSGGKGFYYTVEIMFFMY